MDFKGFSSDLNGFLRHTTSMVHMSADEHQEALAAITEAIKLSRADDDMRGPGA